MRKYNTNTLYEARLSLSKVLSEASFMTPNYFGASTWVEHAPFAFFLIQATRPRCFVELGSHYGYSFFAACQIVKEYELPTHCFAVDTWQGDVHAGFYDRSVYEVVKAHLDQHYSDFAEMKRMTFDEALKDFSDNSIDILHIDGRHFYDDVRHDFNSWLPKLSDSGVVLIHDTQVHEKNFGVHKLWTEITSMYPTFEFHHGHGLGIVAVGNSIPEAL
jgi:hypothetical protein